MLFNTNTKKLTTKILTKHKILNAYQKRGKKVSQTEIIDFNYMSSVIF